MAAFGGYMFHKYNVFIFTCFLHSMLGLEAQTIIAIDNQSQYTLCLKEFDRAIRKPSDYPQGMTCSCTTMIEPGALAFIDDDNKDDGWLFNLDVVLPMKNNKRGEFYLTTLNLPGYYLFADKESACNGSHFGIVALYKNEAYGFPENDLLNGELSNQALFEGCSDDQKYCTKTIIKPYIGFL